MFESYYFTFKILILLNAHIQADEAAAGLLALNLNPGDRIGIWGPNSYEWIVTQYAAARAGLILVLFGYY